jgi:hypothetical protein
MPKSNDWPVEVSHIVAKASLNIQQLRRISSVEDVGLDRGRQGLSFDIVHSLLGEQPFLAQVRRRRHDLGNTYPERVHGLFNWDDGIPRTFWDQCYYRQLARTFHKSISISVSPADAENWKASLGKWVLPYFWIIPNYNRHSLFTCLAKNANRSALTRAFISGICKWSLSDAGGDFNYEGQRLFGGEKYWVAVLASLSDGATVAQELLRWCQKQLRQEWLTLDAISRF